MTAKSECQCCYGSGRVIRDPDIGTDQECFVCEGLGIILDAHGLNHYSASEITVYKQPEPVGYWVMQYSDEAQYVLFAIYAKPTDEQINNTESLLGWKWRDA